MSSVPNVKTALERASKRLPPNYKPLPFVVTHASGIKLRGIDAKGQEREIIDALSCYGTNNTGHLHPRIVKALVDQAGRYATPGRIVLSDQTGVYEDQLCTATGMAKAYLKTGGSEIFDTGTKLMCLSGAKKGVPNGEQKIIVVQESFHGRTRAATASSSDDSARADYGPLQDDLFVKIPFNDKAALAQAIADNGESLVGMIVEPICGEAGILIPDADYLPFAQAICQENNMLFCTDEIQTGMGRTGTLLASEGLGLSEMPDMILMAKSIGGGLLPVSALLTKTADLMDLFSYGRDGSTFSHYPLGTAVASEALNVMLDEKLPQNAAEKGLAVSSGLEELVRKYPDVVTNVRGKGLMIAVDLADGVNAREVCETGIEKGVVFNFTGRDSRSIRITPPLTITQAECAELLETFNQTFASFTKKLA
jgi:ornithine--oxo-acid transaminase